MYATVRLTVSSKSPHGQITVADNILNSQAYINASVTSTTMPLSRATQIIAFALPKDV